MARQPGFSLLSFAKTAASLGPRPWLTVFQAAVVTAALLVSSEQPASAQSETKALQPGFFLGQAAPISIADADRILRARMPGSAVNTAIGGRIGPSQSAALAGALQAQNCGSGSSQPVEITTLAASLKCDVDLIFEYVYNNIEYEPLFGSHKGPLGALLDLRGNDSDQVQLFVALLQAAGYPSSQINIQYGYIRLNGAQASSWLGVKDDGLAIANLFSLGGIPWQNGSLNPDGTLAQIDVAHVWVQVQIGGTSYAFDPSYKQHTVSAGLGNLATVLGYTQSGPNGFLTRAGGSTDSVSIWNINRSNLRSDLAAYANNLIGYIKSQNLANGAALTVNDIIGGKTINYLVGSPIRQTTLPVLSPSQPADFPQDWHTNIPDAYRTCFTISMPGVAPTNCDSTSSQTIKLFADQTYGRRITVSSLPSGSSYIPTLLIDGALPPNGQNTGTAGSAGMGWNVIACVLQPNGRGNGCGALTVKAGGTYLIGAGWGQVGRGMVERHRRLLTEAQAAGNPPTSELVMGESLAVINYTWLAEVAASQQISDAIAKVTTQYHYGVGITGQAPIQDTTLQGPYVDLPFNVLTGQPQTTYSGGGLAPAVVGHFFTGAGISSSLESAVLEQTQAAVAGIQAASTIRLVDQNAATAAKTYFVDGTAAGFNAYFAATTGIRDSLVQYSPGDLLFISCQVSTTCQKDGSPTGVQLLLPASGNMGVGQWHGAGYSVITQTGNTIGITQKISGGLSGGYAGQDVSPLQLSGSTVQQMAAPPATSQVSSSIFANISSWVATFFSDPVDAVTGAYTYQRTDLTTGGGAFPYALAFGRSYSSARRLSDGTLGKGWAHSFATSASRSSDPFAGFGESSPISAAAAIAAIYVSQDLLSGTKTAQNTTVAWMVNRWLTDQLTNNSVTISWPNTGEQFILLPRPDGSPNATYDPPPGSAVVLTGSAPDAYGNFTTFSYLNKDQSRLTFNSVSSPAAGSVASWTFPNGMSLAFAYNHAFNGVNYLSSVTNNLGRSLSLTYSGAHVSAVTDDTGRSVSFGYDAGNLTSSVDPLHFTTSYAYDGADRLTQIFYPTAPAVPFFTNVYDGLGRVNRQANANGNWSSFHLAGSRTEFIDAAGNRHVTYQTPRGRIIKDAYVLDAGVGAVFSDTPQQDGLLNVTASQYDGMDRLRLTTAPEGGSTAYTYDLNSNVLSVTRTPKPGSPLAPQVTSTTYDSRFNKPLTVTDPLGLVTSMSYDNATGNLLSAVADAGSSPHFNARQSFAYNGVGQVLAATDPLGSVTQFAYDSRGNQTSVLRDAGAGRLNQLTSFTHNALGDVISITDPRGNVTTSTYDAARQPLSTTAPNGLVSTSSYDPNGQVVRTQQSVSGSVLRSTSATYTLTGKTASATDANGNTASFGYDALDRVSVATDAMGRVTTYGYDALGRKTAVSNPAIQGSPLLQQAYTPDGLLASLTDANSNVTAFAYDGFDRLDTTTYPLGSTEAFTYDADNNVLTRKTRANQTIAFTYDTLNRLTTKTPSSPAAVVTYGYDLAGRVTGISDTSAAVAAAVPPSGTSVQYTTSLGYDAMNRPTAVTWSPAPTATVPTATSVTFGHSYNKVNQRIGQTVTDNTWLNYPAAAPSTVSYTANALNQYTAVGAVTPSYDGNGNLASDGTFTFGYDAENRLASASATANSASYAYDAQGRRKTKTVNGTTTVFVTDASNREVLEYDGSTGAIQRWYAYGLGPNTVLNQMDVAAAARTTLVPDILGSVIGSLDSGSGGLSKVGYLPYGKSGSIGPFGYTGQRVDTETNELYYYRARHYIPAWGRFMQTDPIGTRGGTNFYAYVGNDPLNFSDPNGLVQDGITSAASDFYELSIIKPANDVARYANDAINDPAYFLNAIGPTLVGLGMGAPATRVGTAAVAEGETGVVGSGGRLGSATTRAQVSNVASEFESEGYTIVGGGGRLPETYIPGPGGGRLGSAYPDITLISPNGNTVYVNTVDTLRNGVFTPTTRELRNALKIESLTGTPVILVPKP